MGHPKCNCTEMYNAGWEVWRCPVHQWESKKGVLSPSEVSSKASPSAADICSSCGHSRSLHQRTCMGAGNTYDNDCPCQGFLMASTAPQTQPSSQSAAAEQLSGPVAQPSECVHERLTEYPAPITEDKANMISDPQDHPAWRPGDQATCCQCGALLSLDWILVPAVATGQSSHE